MLQELLCPQTTFTFVSLLTLSATSKMLTSFPVKPGVRDCFQRANVRYPPGPCQRSLYDANEADHCQIYLCISQYEPVFKWVSIATFLCWLTNSSVLCYLRQVFQSMLKPCAVQATAQRK